MKAEKKEILQKQDILQAIILADNFTECLAPMNKYFPVVLTPVANTPLLDYIVETLIASKVQEIYIYCTNYVEALKQKVDALKKMKNVNISLMINEGCYSMGDAIRDIDSKGNIRGEFILVRGDSMINANLQTYVKNHRIRANNDKGAIMTMLMKNVGSQENSSLRDEMYCVVSDEKTKRMLYYDKLSSTQNKIIVNRRNLIMSENSKFNADLVDTHVYVCSPAVLSLFSDNFDFQTMDDFVQGIIINEEILDSRIYLESLSYKNWGLPLNSWKAYNIVSRDMLQRRFFPLVPETITYSKEYDVHIAHSFYKHYSATVDRLSSIRNFTILGKNSAIGKNSIIDSTVIGSNCKIGNNVMITNSYLISDVSIGDNVSIKDTVVFHDCTIPDDATIDGCIILASSKIDPKVSSFKDCLVRYIKDSLNTVSLRTPVTDDTDELENIRFFKDFGEIEEDEDDEAAESSNDEEDEDQGQDDEEEDLDNQIFLSEVSDSLLRGYQEKLNTDNLILEINSSRYAYNVKVNEVTRIVTKCILKLPVRYLEEAKKEVTTQEYLRTLKGVLVFFEEILKKYNKSTVSQFQVLKAFEEVASSSELFLPALKNVLNYFYEKDLLEESTILEWFEKFEDDDGSEKLNSDVKIAAQGFVDWLREADEDESDEDSDGD